MKTLAILPAAKPAILVLVLILVLIEDSVSEGCVAEVDLHVPPWIVQSVDHYPIVVLPHAVALGLIPICESCEG